MRPRCRVSFIEAPISWVCPWYLGPKCGSTALSYPQNGLVIHNYAGVIHRSEGKGHLISVYQGDSYCEDLYVAGDTGVPIRGRPNSEQGGMGMLPKVWDRPCLYRDRFSIKTVPYRYDITAQGVVGFDPFGNLLTSVEYSAMVAPAQRRAYFGK